MSEPEAAAWKAEESVDPDATRLRELENELELRDRIAGLEARIAELTGGAPRTPSETLAVEHELIELRSSLAWRLGTLLTDPRRLLRRLVHR